MKKQVVIIHGGHASNSHLEYLRSLKKDKVDKDDFITSSKKRWRLNMSARLGNKYEVFTPDMPNADNAKYKEWAIWFERLLPYVKKRAIFVGHSLGAIFLARYFSEKGDFNNTLGVFLIGTPFKTRKSKNRIADFILPSRLNNLRKMGSIIHLYQSKDDKIVEYVNFRNYQKLLPEAQVRIFKDKGHFRIAEFPELLADIRRLKK